MPFETCRRWWSTRILAPVVFAAATGTQAAPVELRTQRPQALPPAVTARAPAVQGTFSPRALDARHISVTLPDGTMLVADRHHLEQFEERTTWIGSFRGEPGGRLSITRLAGIVTGVAEHAGVLYELRPDSEGRHVLYPVDTSRLPDIEPGASQASRKTQPASPSTAVVGELPANFVPVTHDLLVLYTAASAARYGGGTLQSMVVNAVAAVNEAYRNSDVGITLRLVGLTPADVIEAPSGMVETLDRLSASAAANRARDATGADLVVLVNESRDWCGYAYIMWSPSIRYADTAFGSAYSGCLSSDILAHEVGHLQGLMHDRATEPANGALPYGHGYRVCEANGFRDLMSYSCPGISVPRLRSFSNPSRFRNGLPLGIAYETNPALSADAARALNETAPIVAAYRPAAVPANLVAPTQLTGNSDQAVVRLTWLDGSTGESGFKVRRSDAGAPFQEIASLPPDSRRFLDDTVAAGRAYSYQVVVYGGDTEAVSARVTVHVPRARFRLLERARQAPSSRGQRVRALRSVVMPGHVSALDVPPPNGGGRY